ncbi:putative mediator of RNA polymerase II transcription subunit 26 [Pecten maximus]|uniref:putative mediator of RNA polymerase II transcription subunit 26 n=1 Tax=Pecten maximus TaxID=6579 RepID=UPI0014583101|nr:putative mediator of RNA polymerase II transcription subunit 26 [Pecten maximus]
MMLKAALLVCLCGLAVEAFSLSSKLEALAKLKANGKSSPQDFLKHMRESNQRSTNKDSDAESKHTQRSFDGYNNGYGNGYGNMYGNMDRNMFNGEGNNFDMDYYYKYMPKFMYYMQDTVQMQRMFMEFHTNQYILRYQFGDDNNMYDWDENMGFMFQVSQNMYQYARANNWWQQYDNNRGYFGFNNFNNFNNYGDRWNNEGFGGFNNEFNNFEKK